MLGVLIFLLSEFFLAPLWAWQDMGKFESASIHSHEEIEHKFFKKIYDTQRFHILAFMTPPILAFVILLIMGAVYEAVLAHKN